MTNKMIPKRIAYPLAVLIFLLLIGAMVYAYEKPYTLFYNINERIDPLLSFFLAGLLFCISFNKNLFSLKTKLETLNPILRFVILLFVFLLMFSEPERDFLNVFLDQKPIQKITTAIEYKSTYRGRSTTHYEVGIESHALAKKTQVIEVDESYFNSVNIGDRITLDIHRGAFGKPWIEGDLKPS